MSFILLGILNSQVPPSGGGSAYDLLETTVLGTAAASITFSNLNTYSDYKHLQVRVVSRTDRSNNLSAVNLQFNSDSGSNYAFHWIRGTGSTVISEAYTSVGVISFPSASSDFMTANNYSAAVIDILDFSNTSKNTTTRAIGGNPASQYWDVRLASGLWNNTAAVTSLLFTPGFGATNWKAGTRLSLYGIK
jgi:hypothetical protein